MAGYSDQVLKLSIPGDLPIDLEAHYDVIVEGDRRTGETSYRIELGYVDWAIAGHKMKYCLEGNEVPPAMREKILAAITTSQEEMSQALSDEDDEAHFQRTHAAGWI